MSLASLTFVPSWKKTDESEGIWIRGTREFTLAEVMGAWPCAGLPRTVVLEKSWMPCIFWRLEIGTMWLDCLAWERDQPVRWRGAGMGEAVGVSQVCA